MKGAFHDHPRRRSREFLAEPISQLLHAGVLITEQAGRIDALEAEVGGLHAALNRMDGAAA